MSATTKDTAELARQVRDLLGSPAGFAAGQGAHSSHTDPVYMEVPVRIQGSRVVALVRGVTEHVEPFEVETSTLIVLPQGAVVKLSARVTPGQVLVLRNLNTSRQMLCRVVNMKPYANANGGYVEIEFTRSVPGFWGVSFPSEGPNPSGAPVIPTPIPIRAGSTPIAATGSSDDLRSAGIPSGPSVPSTEPAISPAMAEPKEKELPVETTSSAPAAIGSSEQIPSVAAFSSFHEIPKFSIPSEAANLPREPVVPAPIAELSAKEQLLALASSVDAPASIAEGTPVAAPSPAEFPSPFGKFERSAALSYGHASPSTIFGTRLDPQSATKQAAREAQPRRKLLFASLSISILALGFVAGIFFLRRHPDSVAPATVTTSSLATGVSATPVPATQPETPVNAGTSATQPQPSATPESQPGTQGQASASTAADAQEETKAAGDTRRVFMAARKLKVPTVTPEKAAVESEEPPPVVVDALPGGVPGGQAGSAIGGIIPEASVTGVTPLAPLPPKAQDPVRVGGQVKLARVVSSVPPVYPTVAKRVGVEGDVTVQVDIDAAGNVAGVKALSGPALLHQAAMDAVRQWKYEPSTLGGQPIPAQVLVTLKFRLHR